MSQWPLIRAKAVDGKRVDLEKVVAPDALAKLRMAQKTGTRKAHPDLTPGAVGCYLSHLELWKTIAASGAAWAIVFEDDASIEPNLGFEITQAMNDLPPDWDLCLFGYVGNGVPVTNRLVKIKDFLLTHAYAVSAKGARHLARAMLPIEKQVDWAMSDQPVQKYATAEKIVQQGNFGTDIQIPVQEPSKV